MGKEYCIRHLGKMGIIFLASIFFGTVSAAKDWSELNVMSESELTAKITEFQKRLDQKPDDFETLKALGIAYGILAREDAKKFAPKSIDMLTRAYEMNQNDYEVLCYLGNSTTMMANTTWNPMKKMSYANKGIALMDKAIKKAPDNITVRLTRANNAKRLPEFLNRGDVAIEDYEYLAEMIKHDPKALSYLEKEVHANLTELYEKKEKKPHEKMVQEQNGR
jgi:cytochrome c-type biogenesis protein CcmH/NrfG